MLISTRLHGAIDWAAAAALGGLAASRALPARTRGVLGAAAALHAGTAALTDYEAGLRPALTMRQHLLLDAAAGAALAGAGLLGRRQPFAARAPAARPGGRPARGGGGQQRRAGAGTGAGRRVGGAHARDGAGKRRGVSAVRHAQTGRGRNLDRRQPAARGARPRGRRAHDGVPAARRRPAAAFAHAVRPRPEGTAGGARADPPPGRAQRRALDVPEAVAARLPGRRHLGRARPCATAPRCAGARCAWTTTSATRPRPHGAACSRLKR